LSARISSADPNITGLARLPPSHIEPGLRINSPEFGNNAAEGQRFSAQLAKGTSISERGDNPLKAESLLTAGFFVTVDGKIAETGLAG
jgi:hypothetical protein